MHSFFGDLSIGERFHLDRFRLGEKASKKPLILSHRRIFILPTTRGLGFALLIIIMLVASTIYGNNLGFILTFLLGSIAVVSILHSFRTLAGLCFSIKPCAPAFAGDKAVVNCRIENPTGSPRIGVGLKTENALPLQISIDAYSVDHSPLLITCSKRGWYKIGTVTLFSCFPLGLFRAWSPLRLERKILVYPRPANADMPFPSDYSSSTKPQHDNKGDDDFVGFQQYYPGDSVRRICWKAVAKEQGLHTKQYADDLSTVVWLDWAHTPGVSVEQKLSRLCRWVLDAEASGKAYGLRLPLAEIRPNSGPAHQSRCLKTLALYGQSDA